MKQTLVVICIALCVCAATAAEKEPELPTFREYMLKTKASAMSSYRYGVETESMCFKTTELCDEKEGGNVDLKNIQETLACAECPTTHYSSSSYYGNGEGSSFLGDLTVPTSLCSWTTFLKDNSDCMAVPGKTGIKMCGTYIGTCYLNEDTKGGCKFPDTCEDSMLTIQGVIYRVKDVVRVGPENEVECHDDKRTLGNMVPTDKTPAAKTPAAGTAPQANTERVYDHEDKMVQVGKAYVWSGTFTALAHHPLKYKSGWHQYSYFRGDTNSENYSEYKDAMKLPDHVHKFEFVGDAKHPSK